jgi:uncharacterized protein (UPF0261 family)
MPKTVVLVGALDTKGKDFEYVKDLVEKRGLNTLVVDFGVMGAPAFAPDVARGEVAAQHGRAQGRGDAGHGQGAGRHRAGPA